MLFTQIPGLYLIKDSEKGRGVYCSEDISSGSIIELCPVIILPTMDTMTINDTVLHDYYFIWKRDTRESCIALGYGSLYNHSDHPNADFENDYESENIRITALRDIKAHEEITIEYLSKDEDEYSLWFKPK